MSRKNKILLVVDLQKEFADVDNHSKNYNKVLEYVKQSANAGSYDKIISTVFRNGKNDNFRCNLHWDGCSEASIESAEYVKDVDTAIHTIVVKESYGDRIDCIIGSMTDCAGGVVEDAEIHIIGCDLDACVMAVCFRLWDEGITNFKVLTEYCYTTAKDFSKEDVIKIMKRNFGKCIAEE